MGNFISSSNATTLFTKIGERLGLRPKTWTGTQSDWDDLDPSVQAEYEYVNFTDDYTPSQIITWDDWIAMTPEEQAAIPEAQIIGAPGVDGELRSDILKLLWSNPNPTSAFASQNITLSSDDYDLLLCVYKRTTDNAASACTMALKGGALFLQQSKASSDGAGAFTRDCWPVSGSSTVFNFSDTYGATGTTAAGVNNNYLIPLKIYGVKSTIKLKFDAIASDVSTSANKCMMPDGETNVAEEISGINGTLNTISGLPLMGVATGRNNAGESSVVIDISNLVFDDNSPLFINMIFRNGVSSTNDGTAIIKINWGTVVITSKTNASSLTGVSYDSVTKRLTLTCSDYTSVLVYGKLKMS